MREWAEGEKILVRLHGDLIWYLATALDRPRKMWCRLEPNQPSPAWPDGMIADENSIAEWRPVE